MNNDEAQSYKVVFIAVDPHCDEFQDLAVSWPDAKPPPAIGEWWTLQLADGRGGRYVVVETQHVLIAARPSKAGQQDQASGRCDHSLLVALAPADANQPTHFGPNVIRFPGQG